MPLTDLYNIHLDNTQAFHEHQESWEPSTFQEPLKPSTLKPFIRIIKEIPAQQAQPVPVNPYYQDTISSSEAEAAASFSRNENSHPNEHAAAQAHRRRVDHHLENISSRIDAELQREDRDFEKLQTMIYNVIMLMMRLAARADQENIREIQIKIQHQAQEIKATYNTWQGMTITVVSSAVSIGAGVLGFTPFFPAAVISAESARLCANAATSAASAGTGIGGLGSIANNRSEGTRRVYEIYLKQTQDTEEERKSSRHTKSDHVKTAKAAADQFTRDRHDARRAVFS